MTIYTPPTDETFSRDLHLSRGPRHIHIGQTFNLPQAADPKKAVIPSLKPSLYIYDIATLTADLQGLRADKVRALQGLDPQRNTLTIPVFQMTIERYDRVLDDLAALTAKDKNEFIQDGPVENIRPAFYGYEVKMLRDVFEMAHNAAHQKVLRDRANKSHFVGASEAVLKEVAIDHVTVLNSREAGHQYLVSPRQIESTLVRTNPGTSHGSLQTLTRLREQGLARPAAFHF